jgi:KaiC/GvpD/RAD55 family RecA-like ATPase
LLSVKKSVPTEIVRLLEQGGRSLHIKGSAGTGKTTLVLEIVRSMYCKGSAIYLSTRVSPGRILTQFPWVNDCLEEKNILDAKRSYITSENQRIWTEFTDQAEFMRLINEKIQRSEPRPVTVIIDSLEALKTNLNIQEGDNTIETILLELGEKTDTNMLFVTETDEPCRLDYLVDGVIRLEKDIFNGRLVRKMYLEKIRGEQIQQPYYLFTLNEGRFTSFRPNIHLNLKYDTNKLVAKQENFIPTGIKLLDTLGGIPKGTFNLLENTNGMGMEYAYILFPIVVSFMQRGYPIFITHLYSNSIQSTYRSIISQMGIKYENIASISREYIHYFEFTESKGPPMLNPIRVPKGSSIGDFNELFKESVTKTVEKLGANTFLWFVGVDTMERIYGGTNFRKAIGTLAHEANNLNGIIIAFAKHGVRSMDSLIHLSTSHFVLDNVGAPVIYGVTPKTGMFAIATETVNGLDRIVLVPVE